MPRKEIDERPVLVKKLDLVQIFRSPATHLGNVLAVIDRERRGWRPSIRAFIETPEVRIPIGEIEPHTVDRAGWSVSGSAT